MNTRDIVQHELKMDAPVFHKVAIGEKTFELRKNDRNFQVGDVLWLRETIFTGEQMREEGEPLLYTGNSLYVNVIYILHGPCYGLEDGWCIMSIDKP